MPSLEPDPKPQGRLLLVSNRLPITIKRSEDGSYNFSMSSGGLVTGLSGLAKTTTFQWYGWPGLEVPEAEAAPLVKQLSDEYGAVPVFVDDELADRHYNGFSSACARKGTGRSSTNCWQIPSFGHSFITILERSHSTSRHGQHTKKSIACSQRRWQRMYKMVI